MYSHKFDNGDCSKNGKYAEKLFIERFNKRFPDGYVEKTILEEDKYKHKDFTFGVFDKNTRLHVSSCDVKYPKKINRSDDNVSTEYVWVEFMTKGHLGWLFGEQDFIAFLLPKKNEEDEEKFLMVKRQALLDLCSNIVKNEIRLDKTPYTIFVRTNITTGLLDSMSLIKYDDLRTLKGTWEL